MLIETTFRKLYRPLCVYAMHYLNGDVEESEDIVQNCFVKLWEVRPDNERAFLYTAVRNACIDHLRRIHPEVMNFAPYDLDGMISDDEARDRSFTEARLWKLIDELPDRCREIPQFRNPTNSLRSLRSKPPRMRFLLFKQAFCHNLTDMSA